MDYFATRLQWTDQFGALTIDTAISPKGNVVSNVNSLYNDLPTLLRTAAGVLEMAPDGHYFSFHSGRGIDIVITLIDGKPLARWSATGPAIAALTPTETEILAEDAALRNVVGTIEAQGFEVAAPAIERALAIAPMRRELVKFAEQLVRVGRNALAGRIVDARLDADPDDISALILDADMTMKIVNAGQWGKEHLADADANLVRVLALQPDNLHARLMWCDIPRYSGDTATSTKRFTELLALHPDVDAAHYNLGAIYLAAADPERALVHFTSGERLAPKDADYPLGRVRSLLALGRTADARSALARASELDPDHRLIPKLREQLS